MCERPLADSAGPAAHHLDARRLLCPLPVIRLQALVRTLSPGSQVEVVATDPGVMHDIPAWCRIHGHEIVTMTTVDREFWLTVRTGEAPK